MSCQEKGKRKFQAEISKVTAKGVEKATNRINSDKQWWFVLKFCSYKSIFEQVSCHTNILCRVTLLSVCTFVGWGRVGRECSFFLILGQDHWLAPSLSRIQLSKIPVLLLLCMTGTCQTIGTTFFCVCTVLGIAFPFGAAVLIIWSFASLPRLCHLSPQQPLYLGT